MPDPKPNPDPTVLVETGETPIPPDIVLQPPPPPPQGPVVIPPHGKPTQAVEMPPLDVTPPPIP